MEEAAAPEAEGASPKADEAKTDEKRASAAARPSATARASASAAPRPSQQAAAPASEAGAGEPPRASVKEGPRPSATPRDAPADAPRASATPADAPRASATSKDAPRPSATTTDTPRESVKDAARTSVKEPPADAPRASATPADAPRASATPKDAPRPSATAKETPRESVKDAARTSVKEPPADAPRASATPADAPRASATAKDTPRESVKEAARTSVKEQPRTSINASPEAPRESVKESPRVSNKESPRDSSSRPPQPSEVNPRKESVPRLVPNIDPNAAKQKLAAFKGSRMRTQSPLMNRASAPASIEDGVPSISDLYPGDQPRVEQALAEPEKPPVEREDTSHLPPLPPGWEEFYSDEGDAYYFCEATGETTWDRPAPLPEKPPAPPAAAEPAGATGTPTKSTGPLKFSRNARPPDEKDSSPRDDSPGGDKNVTPGGVRRWGLPGAKVAELAQVRGDMKNAANAPKQTATTVTAMMQNLHYDEIEKIQGSMPTLMRDKLLDKLTKDNEQIKRDFDTKKVALETARKEVEKWTMARDKANIDILEMEERYNKNMDQIITICDNDNLEYPEQVNVDFSEAQCVPVENSSKD